MRALTAIWLAVALAACSDDGVDSLTARNAWAPPTGASVDGDVYLTLISPVDTNLRQVEVPAEIASAASVQDATGAVQDLALLANEAVTLAPGGDVIVLRNLVEPLDEGDQFDLLLVVERADPLRVTVTVRVDAPD